jgi:flavin reductase (DIM6/NTAB) family NADH-FMN oxidoreductase RutF
MKKRSEEIGRCVPCPVTLLSVKSKQRLDAMTASAMFVSERPPLLVVSIAKRLVSHDLIEEAGEFVLNVASTNQVKLAKQLGFTHGSEVDKFKRFHVPMGKARKVKAPVIKGSFAMLECHVITSLSTAKYVIYLAEVVGHKVDQKLTPIAWWQNKYFALDKEVR